MPTDTLLSADDLRAEIERSRQRRNLTHDAMARTTGLSAGFIGMVLSGAREPSKAFLEAFGYERVTFYKRKRTAA
jgi:transcriptional regulator with XRE-family HTH domain